MVQALDKAALPGHGEGDLSFCLESGDGFAFPSGPASNSS